MPTLWMSRRRSIDVIDAELARLRTSTWAESGRAKSGPCIRACPPGGRIRGRVDCAYHGQEAPGAMSMNGHNGEPSGVGPLSHIKVLDLCHARAGPTCVRVLADFGADVIQV